MNHRLLCVVIVVSFSALVASQTEPPQDQYAGRIPSEAIVGHRYYWDKDYLVGYKYPISNNEIGARLWGKSGKSEVTASIGKEGAQYLRVTGADATDSGGLVIGATYLPKEAPREGYDYLRDFIVRTDEFGRNTGTLDVPPHAATMICSVGENVWLFGGIQKNRPYEQ